MTPISETRAGKARASRNSCAGSFRVSNTDLPRSSQEIPPLIALHIGEERLAKRAEAAAVATDLHSSESTSNCASSDGH